jgi:4-amino-4-deoxy-L-arabinose transferase-like glycosyltransferase
MKSTLTTEPEQKPPSVIELSGAQAWRLRDAAVLVSLCLILLFWGLGDLPFYTRGEPREGLVVWEMNSSGNWILPVVNGEYIPFKPPLFHWLALLAGSIFGGIDEFTLRLPSALLAAAGVLMIYRTGARLWGKKAGVVAGIVLLTCGEWWQAGTITQVDMTLTFFISAACLYFYFLYRRQDFGLVKSLGLPLLLGLATLAKGPLGLAVPCLVFLVFLWLRRDFAFVKKLHLLASATVFFLVAGSWYGAARWQAGPAFFFRQIVDENFRTAAGTYGHFQPIYYYIPVFLENTIPWTFFFPPLALFIYKQRDKLSEQEFLFPLTWLITGFIFFSASFGKRGVYILPLYPPTALLFGAWWQRLEESTENKNPLTRIIGFLVAYSCLFILVALCFHFAAESGLVRWSLLAWLTKFKNLSRILRSLASPSPLVVACLLIYAAGVSYLIWALLKQNWRLVFASLASIAVASSVIMEITIFPPLAYELTLKPFMARVQEKINPEVPLIFYRGFDYGAVFYAGRHIPRYVTEARNLKPPFYLLMWEEDYQPLRDRDDLKILDVSEGRGPAGRHRLALVEYRSSPTSAPLPLPIYNRRDPAENYRD